ncbi:MAG: cytochrome c oxidase subunit II [Actinomycetota bacterium]|nr:cytochrome c oxidase subunit II [Actinomycetota bacterium]
MVDTRATYQDLLDVYWPIGVGVFGLITLLIVVFAVRYRDRGPEHDRPRRAHHERTPVEGGYVVVLALIAATLVFLTFTTMSDSRAGLPAQGTARTGELAQGGTDEDAARSGVQAPPADLAIEVTAARWNWRFDYPELGITQVDSGRGVPTLVVPAGANVRFDMTSLDVIHSFYIPRLRFKRDAFPERLTSFTLGFDEPGFYADEGRCAEFCGLRHANMLFDLRVLEQAAFRAWAAERRGEALR